MRQRLRTKLTYANVMVTILAFLVFGGATAFGAIIVSSNSQVAGGTISGHNPPSGKHANIISGSVAAGDLQNGAVGPGKLRNNSVSSPKVLNNSLTGDDINESTLGTVPNATHANSADNATNATNAQTLGGTPASGFQSRLRFAVVSANATGAAVTRGNATAAGRIATGDYFVSFQGDIRGCAYLATNGDTAAGVGPPGEISVEQRNAANPTDVEVRHYNSAGAQTDYVTGAGDGFHIAVIC